MKIPATAIEASPGKDPDGLPIPTAEELQQIEPVMNMALVGEAMEDLGRDGSTFTEEEIEAQVKENFEHRRQLMAAAKTDAERWRLAKEFVRELKPYMDFAQEQMASAEPH